MRKTETFIMKYGYYINATIWLVLAVQKYYEKEWGAMANYTMLGALIPVLGWINSKFRKEQQKDYGQLAYFEYERGFQDGVKSTIEGVDENSLYGPPK